MKKILIRNIYGQLAESHENFIVLDKGESYEALLSDETEKTLPVESVSGNYNYEIVEGDKDAVTVDPNTGKITPHQIATATLRATETASGNYIEARLFVKYGNPLFHIKVLTYSTNLNEKLIYSKNIQLHQIMGMPFNPVTHLQNFDIGPSGRVYYFTPVKKTLDGKKDYGGREGFIIRANPNNSTSGKKMKTFYMGHMNCTDVEISGSTQYIWSTAVATEVKVKDGGGINHTGNIAISRFQFIDGSNAYKFAANTVIQHKNDGDVTHRNGDGLNFVYCNASNLKNTSVSNYKKYLFPAVDEKRRLLAVGLTGKILIYNLDQVLSLKQEEFICSGIELYTSGFEILSNRTITFKAGNLKNLTPLVTINTDDYVDTSSKGYVSQGFCIDGDYLYMIHSQREYIWNTLVTKVALSNLSFSQFEVKAFEKNGKIWKLLDAKKMEAEGIKVDTSGSKPIMYIGAAVTLNNGRRTATILKYIDNTD